MNGLSFWLTCNIALEIHEQFKVSIWVYLALGAFHIMTSIVRATLKIRTCICTIWAIVTPTRNSGKWKQGWWLHCRHVPCMELYGPFRGLFTDRTRKWTGISWCGVCQFSKKKQKTKTMAKCPPKAASQHLRRKKGSHLNHLIHKAENITPFISPLRVRVSNKQSQGWLAKRPQPVLFWQ